MQALPNRRVRKKHHPTIEQALWGGLASGPRVILPVNGGILTVDHQAIHRATGNPGLTHPGSVPYISARNGGVLRRTIKVMALGVDEYDGGKVLDVESIDGLGTEVLEGDDLLRQYRSAQECP